jgi:hypothetical protein
MSFFLAQIIILNYFLYVRDVVPSTTDQRSEVRSERRALRKPRLTVPPATLTCCSQVFNDVTVKRYLVMGVNSTEGLVPTFVLPWLRQKVSFLVEVSRFFRKIATTHEEVCERDAVL